MCNIIGSYKEMKLLKSSYLVWIENLSLLIFAWRLFALAEHIFQMCNTCGCYGRNGMKWSPLTLQHSYGHSVPTYMMMVTCYGALVGWHLAERNRSAWGKNQCHCHFVQLISHVNCNFVFCRSFWNFSQDTQTFSYLFWFNLGKYHDITLKWMMNFFFI